MCDAFAAPSSENVRASIFGEDGKDSVIELHRLVLLDEVPKNGDIFFHRKSFEGIEKTQTLLP